MEPPKIDVPDEEEEVAAVPKIDCDCPEEPNVLAAVVGANRDLFGDEEDPAKEACPDCPKALLAPKTDVDDPDPPPPPKIDGCTAVVDVCPKMELLGGAVLLWPPPNNPPEEEEEEEGWLEEKIPPDCCVEEKRPLEELELPPKMPPAD